MDRLILSYVCFNLLCFLAEGNIERPRGVSISMASIYTPNAEKVFTCVDGSQKIPYGYINDDYCDCADGSDEPGTAACTNGKFHCTNAGYLPKYIQSSRVNDGVCDCCDGTDEYSGNIQCENNCKELGLKLREEQEVNRQLQEQGFKKRQEFSDEGKKLFEEKKLKIQELEKEKDELQGKLKELEDRKKEAEDPERDAKEKHQKAWEETKDKKASEKSFQNAKEAFEDLDTDKDGFVDVLEIVVHQEFDIDSNGIVSDEEAKEHLEDHEKVDFENFHLRVWPNIKEIFKKLVPDEPKEDEQPDEPRGDTATPVPPTGEEQKATPPPLHHDGDYDDENEEEEEDDEDDDDDIETQTEAPDEDSPDEKESQLLAPNIQLPPEENKEEEEKMPDYDENTKQLIAAADEARSKYDEADKRSKDIDSEISSMTSYLNTDFGNDKEFAILKENCFEYTDREYTYKLCPFGSASQRPKNGGSETSLGHWGKWDGPPNDIYSVQKYEKGQNCWNGPDRSVRIHFTCGNDHRLTNAYEPSRCEYAFDFSTPCSCNKPPVNQKTDNHDEL